MGYATLREGAFGRTVEVTPGVLADLDRHGAILGIEVLDGSDWRDALAALAMTGRLRVAAAAPPVKTGRNLIIEWPAPRGDGMPGSLVSLHDADSGEQITTATRMVLTAAAGDVITAVLTVAAGEGGEPVYTGLPFRGRAVDAEFTVTSMASAVPVVVTGSGM